MVEKQSKSRAYKALEQQTAQLKRRLSQLLLSQHQYPRKSARRTERIAALTNETPNRGKLRGISQYKP